MGQSKKEQRAVGSLNKSQQHLIQEGWSGDDNNSIFQVDSLKHMAVDMVCTPRGEIPNAQ